MGEKKTPDLLCWQKKHTLLGNIEMTPNQTPDNMLNESQTAVQTQTCANM